MREITENVYLLAGLRGANVYLLVSDHQLALVDTGLPGDADRIVGQVEHEGYSPDQLRTIILTHAHADHVGGAAKLRRRLDVQVAAHRDEVPYIEGRESLPARGLLQNLMRWVGGLTPSGETGIPVERSLEDGQILDILGGLRVLHTPGHTPGGLSLYQDSRQILFCGDLLTNGHPLTGRGGLRYGPRLFSVDPEQMEQSARRLADLSVEILCVGHGEPVLKDGGGKLAALHAERRKMGSAG